MHAHKRRTTSDLSGLSLTSVNRGLLRSSTHPRLTGKHLEKKNEDDIQNEEYFFYVRCEENITANSRTISQQLAEFCVKGTNSISFPMQGI